MPDQGQYGCPVEQGTCFVCPQEPGTGLSPNPVLEEPVYAPSGPPAAHWVQVPKPSELSEQSAWSPSLATAAPVWDGSVSHNSEMSSSSAWAIGVLPLNPAGSPLPRPPRTSEGAILPGMSNVMRCSRFGSIGDWACLAEIMIRV